MRIAILGAGTMGSEHADVYANIAGAEIVYLYGRDLTKLKPLAKKYRAQAVTDLDRVLGDKSVEAIDVCLPSPMHRDFVVKALNAGKHVFCETPLALTLEDAEAMRSAAKRSGRLLLVGLLMRSIAEYQYIKRTVENGELGKPLAAYACRLGSYLRGDGFDHKDHYGDPTTELMTFDYDVMGWLFGKPQAIYATGSNLPDGRPGHVVASLDYGDFAAQIEASGVMPPSFPYSIGLRIIGSRQALEIATKIVRDEPPETTLTSYPAEGKLTVISLEGSNPYEVECRYFVDCVLGKADPELLSVDRAIEALKLSLATQKSLKDTSRVTLE